MLGRPELRILVVIPAWNEAGAVAGTISEVRAARPDVDILVVDDGSGDGTAEVARRGRRPGRQAPVQPRCRRRDARGLPLRHARATTTSRCRSTPTASTTRAYLPPAGSLGLEGSADVVIGARFAGEGDLHGLAVRGGWRCGMLAVVLSPDGPHPAHRRHERLPGRQPARAAASSPHHYPAEYLGDTVESLVIALRVGCTVTQEPVQMRVRQVGHGQPVAAPRRAVPRPGRRRARPRPRTPLAGRTEPSARRRRMSSTVTLGVDRARRHRARALRDAAPPDGCARSTP